MNIITGEVVLKRTDDELDNVLTPDWIFYQTILMLFKKIGFHTDDSCSQISSYNGISEVFSSDLLVVYFFKQTYDDIRIFNEMDTKNE